MAYVGRPAPQFQFDALVKNSFSGNGSTTAFTLTKSPASVNSLLVLVNNVVQEPATAFTLSDTTLTFTSAPPSGSSNIYACFWGGTLGITTAVKLDTSNVAAITGNLTSSSNVAFSLGEPSKAWKELYVGGTAITEEGFHLPDNDKLTLGNSSDLQIYHNGSHSYISEEGTGQLYIRTNYLSITNAAGSETMTFFDDDGAVSLYYDGTAKLATTGTGLNVTGIGANVAGNVSVTKSLAVGYTDGRVPQANLDVKGNTYLGANVYIAASTNYPDNSKAVFGNSADLQIYHDGSNSYLAKEIGTGALITWSSATYIRGSSGEDMIKATTGGAVEAFYANSPRLATKSTGVNVTGEFDITKSAQAQVRVAGVIGGTGQTTLGTNAYQNTTPQFNFADAQNWSITLANNVSLANPLNAKVGQTGSVFVQQDGVGSRTMSFQKSWIWAADSAPTLTTTASANDRIDYIVQAVYANNMAQGIQAVATLDLK